MAPSLPPEVIQTPAEADEGPPRGHSVNQPHSSIRSYVRADDGSHILVIEDHPVTLEFVRFALNEYGYRVSTAMSTEEGIQALDDCLPDLVVLDLLLPGAHGLDVCKHLRGIQDAADIPVLVITEDDRPQSHGEAVRAGVDDFLRKPILATELQTRVRSLLRLRRLRRQLRTEKEAIRTLQVQQEQMVQFVMHDIKNLLGALLTRAGLLETEQGEVEWRRHTQAMAGCARSLQDMLANFLDLTLADHASPLRLDPLPLRPWLKQVVGEFENFGARRKHAFEVTVEDVDNLHGNPHLLRRTLFNLLDNASRFAPEASPIHVHASATTQGDQVCLSVSDLGPGVPDDIKERIFERLFLVEGSGLGHSGRGLGLAFCKLVAQRHGGEIHVEDNQPCGSRFVLRLPMGPVN